MRRFLFSLIPFLFFSFLVPSDASSAVAPSSEAPPPPPPLIPVDETKGLEIEESNLRTLASLYQFKQLDQDLDLYIGGADDCHELQICGIKAAGGDGEKFTVDACNTDLITFRPLENTVKIGAKMKYFQRPVARFNAKGNGKYILSVQGDFDGHMESTQKDEDVEVTLSKDVIVLVSGIACPARLRAMNEGFAGQRVLLTQIQDDKPRAGLLYHQKRTSPLKDSNLKKGEGKPTDCCFNGYADYDSLFVNDLWLKDELVSDKITWQRYLMDSTINNKTKNALRSFVLKVKPGCRWLRLCLDSKNEETNGHLCEMYSLDMLFEAGVYIPIDTEQASAFIAQEDTADLSHFVLEMSRSLSETYLTLKYGQVEHKEDWYAVEHKMFSPPFADEMYVTVVSAPKCQAGLMRNLGNVALNMPNLEQSVGIRQQVHLRNCECFTK